MSETAEAPAAPPEDDTVRGALLSAFKGQESAPEPEPHDDPAPASADRPRDEAGRFKAREPEEVEGQGGPPSSPEPTETTEAAPQEPARPEPKAPEADTWAAPLRAVLEPYRAKHAMMGLSDADAVGRLLAAEQQLRDNPDQAFPELARAYGFDIRKLIPQPQQQPPNPNDPFAAMQQQIAEIRGHLTQQQQAAVTAQQNEAAASVEAFRADPTHPHFDQVRVHMGALIQAGVAKDLEDAYQQAVWASPTARSAVLAEQQKADEAKRQTEARARAEAARKAAVSVRTSGGAGTTTQEPADSVRAELLRAMRG